MYAPKSVDMPLWKEIQPRIDNAAARLMIGALRAAASFFLSPALWGEVRGKSVAPGLDGERSWPPLQIGIQGTGLFLIYWCQSEPSTDPSFGSQAFQ